MAKQPEEYKKMDSVAIDQARQYFICEIQRMEPEGIQKLWEFYVRGDWNRTIWTMPPSSHNEVRR